MAFSDRDRDGDRVYMAVGLVVGAMVIGLVWLITALMLERQSQADAPAAARGQAELADAAGRQQRPHGTADLVLARCEEVYRAQAAPLRTAGPALSQWEVHIGAMNQFVAGTISLQQAQRFWNQTRIGAHRRLERYGRSVERYRARTARCTAATQVSRPREHQCVAAVTARSDALRAAAVSIATWRTHVHHMEMLRDGEMTPAEAARAWLKSWHQGSHELRVYLHAARTARDADSVACSPRGRPNGA